MNSEPCIKNHHSDCPGLCTWGNSVLGCSCKCHRARMMRCEKCGQEVNSRKELKNHLAITHAY